MKEFAVFAAGLFIASLAFAQGVTQKVDTARGIAANPPANSTISQATNAVEETVYVTKTGKKYHVAGCRYLAKSAIPMKLSKAQEIYTPCSICGGSTKTTSDSVAKSTDNSPPAPSSQTSTVGSGTPSGETTATGIPIYVGPRGGRYHYSASGNKVYERKRK